MNDAGVRAASAAVRALKALARERADEVELFDGFTDAELDAWTVRVPPDVRLVLREIGGLETQEHDYRFGPRGRAVFGEGYWTLGELDFGEGELVVGVGDDGWGPVVGVNASGYDPDVTVEAADFVGWLASLASRLADGVSERPRAEVTATASSSVEVAEGTDSELAALVGRGDPLTDLVDLRALPGYPCAIAWEPYFSTAHNTADTGSSEVQFRFVGDGRALLLRSVVSGDFLGRPVRRHTVPADAGPRAVAGLRELAGRHPGFVELEPGCSDADMDGWAVPVPEDVRAVLREVGAVRVAGLPRLRLLAGTDGPAVDPELHRMLGGDGTYWPLARIDSGRSGALVQIRVDRESGQWGYALSVPTTAKELREYPEVTLVAESLADLLLTYVRLAGRAAERPDFAGRVSRDSRWMLPNTGEPWPRPAPVGEWAGSADPLLAAAAELPDGTHAADLRRVPIPSDLCFYRAAGWPYAARLDRLHFAAGGRVAAAVPARRRAGAGQD
ncbi:hypothetical protein GCM10010371_35260 [Streptomyces subrutilus]|uniref:Uncharacterized protein n=1 Tax=Streptomyces subrutilus TaxID=36818 RepID=A0A5P2UZ13_9ACTN|nr:hypothetical protein [Streptomyces subrutilus]QEU81987.1 hypothetical protein CP968_30240 [Streptomyces subrutilus]GGZ72328.1 hypothetical protein GCM10010371_35260 [Streptomyces subrutilus]